MADSGRLSPAASDPARPFVIRLCLASDLALQPNHALASQRGFFVYPGVGSIRKLCTEQLPTKNDLIVKFFNIQNYGAVGNMVVPMTPKCCIVRSMRQSASVLSCSYRLAASKTLMTR